MVQELESSRLSRELINLFIGMCFGSPDLPRELQAAGYGCHSIEQSFPVSATQFANPEILLVSPKEGHTLILESKSGANLNEDQLLRYALIASASLSQAAQVPPDAAGSYNLLIVGKEAFSERLCIGTSKVPDPNRVLSVKNAAGITRLEGAFVRASLNDAFDPTLAVNWDFVPTRYFPVDSESQDWQFAEYMIPEVIAWVLAGADELMIEDVAKSVILHWDFIAAPYQKRLRTRMLEVLRRAAGRRFTRFFRVTPHKQANAKIVIFAAAAKENSKLKSQLATAYRGFMDDLQSPQMEIPYPDPTAPS